MKNICRISYRPSSAIKEKDNYFRKRAGHLNLTKLLKADLKKLLDK
jgi:hypothetical protein